MEPLKEMFNRQWITSLATAFKLANPNFADRRFINDALKGLEPLSLNERLHHITRVLHKYLPGDYTPAIVLMKQVIPTLQAGYTNLVFPNYVSLYGLGHYAVSMEALKFFTRFGSSEFAIRVFLKNDLLRTLKVMEKWATDKDPHVRRLASEGSRPRLPWSFKFDAVIADPSLTGKILEKLKHDDHLYVRKSVANHLNDISKDHPAYALKLMGGWNKADGRTGWIIRHASRGLFKQGHQGSFALFNYEPTPALTVKNFKVSPRLNLGDTLVFELELVSAKNKSQKLMVDYVIHYQKKTTKLSPKVFKWKEIELGPAQKIHLSKKQVLKNFTTRTHHAGKHLLEIQVNGKKFAGKAFHLVV